MENKTRICEVVIPNYIDKIAISKHRRAQYYKVGDPIPFKYKSPIYKFVPAEDGVLTDMTTMDKVVKNSRSVGKPRYWSIAGNDVLSGIDYNLRSKVFKEVKKYFYEVFRDVPHVTEDQYPLEIGIDFYDLIGDYDLDNLVIIYRKCLTDALCGNVDFDKVPTGRYNKNKEPIYSWVPNYIKYPKKIIDDSVRYITSEPTRFFPVDDYKDRRLVITINSLTND